MLGATVQTKRPPSIRFSSFLMRVPIRVTSRFAEVMLARCSIRSRFISRVNSSQTEDAERLRDDGFGDGEIDLAVGGEVEKVLRLASELHCADENVGVSDDPLHDWARDS